MTEMLQAPHAPHSWAPWQQPETEALWARIAHLEAYTRVLKAEKEELKEEVRQALTCPTTDLWTLRGWQQQARPMVADGTTVVVFCDLNKFKPVNDTYGHHVGNAVLKIIGRRLTTWCAPLKGVPGRAGMGDEFVAAFRPVTQLQAHLRDLKAAITTPIRWGGHTLSVGVSIGTEYTVGRGDRGALERLEAAVEAADQKMYDEKRVFYEEPGNDRRGRPVLPPRETGADASGPVATE